MASLQVEPDPNLVRPPVNPRPTENPLEAVLRPILEPFQRQIGLTAAAAEDAALFFSAHPEALKYRGDLVKAHKTLRDQGTPFTYDAVWAWIMQRLQLSLDVKLTIEDAYKSVLFRSISCFFFELMIRSVISVSIVGNG